MISISLILNRSTCSIFESTFINGFIFFICFDAVWISLTKHCLHSFFLISLPAFLSNVFWFDQINHFHKLITKSIFNGDGFARSTTITAVATFTTFYRFVNTNFLGFMTTATKACSHLKTLRHLLTLLISVAVVHTLTTLLFTENNINKFDTRYDFLFRHFFHVLGASRKGRSFTFLLQHLCSSSSFNTASVCSILEFLISLGTLLRVRVDFKTRHL